MCQQLVEGFVMPTPLTNATINEIKIDANDKTILAGDFKLYDNAEIGNMIKLNSDGSLDSEFVFIDDKIINHIEFLSTGEIIALDTDSLYKVNEFGTIVNSIDIGVSTTFSDIVIKDDFIILVGNGLGLKKFDSNLSLIAGFKNDNIFDGGALRSVAIQNEKILVAGSFSSVNGVSQNDISRFDSNGNLDGTFDTGSGTSDFLGTLFIQDDGKILLGETFINEFNGSSFQGLARLNEDGSIDSGFNPPKFNGPSEKVLWVNDKILVSVFFNDGLTTENRLIRLNNDGTLDNTFNTINETISEIGLPSTGEIITNANVLAKYSATGVNIVDFFSPLIKIGSYNNAEYFNDFLIVTGDFTSLNNVETYQIGKVDLNGIVDSNFIVTQETNTASTVNLFPFEIKIRDEDEIFVSLGNKLLKIDHQGSPVPGFNTPTEVIRPGGGTETNFAGKFELLDDGKIVTAGPNGLYILSEAGVQDTSFDFENTSGINGAYSLGLQTNEKIIYASASTEINNESVNRLVRLNLDGSIDPSFDFGVGPSSSVNYINVALNDEIIVGSSGFNGFSSNLGIFKLSSDGIFNTEYPENINTSLQEPFFFYDGVNFKGKSLLFTYVNFSTFEQSIGKLSGDGSLLTDFSLDADILIADFPAQLVTPRAVGEKMFLLLGDFTISSENIETKGLLFIDNSIPVITASSSLSTPEETPLLISLDDLTVEEPDNEFPTDFSLTVLAGDNYTITESQVIPAIDFNGSLTVPVTVNDGIDDSEPFMLTIEVTAVLSTNSYDFADISVYPNPVKKHLIIDKLNKAKSTHLIIYNLDGVLMYQRKNVEREGINIDVSSFAEGIYILILNSNGNSRVKKVVKF